MGRCGPLRRLFVRCVGLPDDTPQEEHKKITSLAFCIVAFIAGMIGPTGGRPYFVYHGFAMAALNLIFGAILVVRKRIDTPWIACFAAHLTIQAFTTDFGSLSVQRTWPVLVIVVDWLLIIQAPSLLSKVIVALACVYLCVCELELTFRFGLMDIPGTYSYEELREMSSCQRPPCARESGVEYATYLFPQIFVFVLDFVFTRGFAEGLQNEHQRMEDAIRTADHIAAGLARFQIEEARSDLVKHGSALPPALLTSFETVLYNLEAYRPYLPQSCLEKTSASTPDEAETRHVVWEDSDAESDTHAPAGADDNQETMVESLGGSTVDKDSVTSKSDDIADTPSSTYPRIGRESSTAFHHAAPRVTLRENYLRAANVALVQLSFRLPSCGQVAEYIQMHEAMVATVLAATADVRGMVDTFEGSRMVMSFNASRSVPQYALMAVRVILKVASTPDIHTACSGVVAAGAASVGVLGTETMRRPQIMGRLPRRLDVLERFAAAVQVTWLCNTHVYQDIRLYYEARLVIHFLSFGAGSRDRDKDRLGEPGLQECLPISNTYSSASLAHAPSRRSVVGGGVVHPASAAAGDPSRTSLERPPAGDVSGPGAPQVPLLYEIVPGSLGATHIFDDPSAEEWMYALEKSSTLKWEDYNEAGALFIRTCIPEAALCCVRAENHAALEAAIKRACVIDLAARAARPGTNQPCPLPECPGDSGRHEGH